MKTERSLATCWAVAVFVAMGSAAAQPEDDAARLARGTALFEEGTSLLDAGRPDDACPKLEEAVALVPVASGAFLALGACREARGQLASAMAAYARAASLAAASRQADREQRAREAHAALAPRVGTLTLDSTAVRDAAGLEVRLDGAPVALDALGRPVAADAGEHAIEVRAAGHEPWSTRVRTADGETRDVGLGLGRSTTPVAVAPPPPIRYEPEPPSGSPLRTVGLVVGGVGIAALAVGAVGGVLAIGSQSDSEGFCSPDDFCSPEGYDARSDAFSMATMSTIGFVAGGALLATGIVLFVAGGDGDVPHASAAVGPRGVLVRGAF